MSRGLSTANLAEATASHYHGVVLVKLLFDTPIFVHSGWGSIVFGGDTYLGVGTIGHKGFGGVEGVEESELVAPTSINLVLSGVDAGNITEARDAGNYGDAITAFVGYRQNDGALVDDPWILARGTFEYASVELGNENKVVVTMQHELVHLNDTDGARYTDEDQQRRFAGDKGLSFAVDMIQKKNNWRGGPVGILDNSFDWQDRDAFLPV